LGACRTPPHLNGPSVSLSIPLHELDWQLTRTDKPARHLGVSILCHSLIVSFSASCSSLSTSNACDECVIQVAQTLMIACLSLIHRLIDSLILQWHRHSVVVVSVSLDDVAGLGLGKLSVNILFKFQRCLLEREREIILCPRSLLIVGLSVCLLERNDLRRSLTMPPPTTSTSSKRRC